MKDVEINRKIAEVDESTKRYVDMKIRAVKKLVAPFIWMRNNPWKTLGGLIILFMLSALAFHELDFRKLIKNRTGIEFKE